MGFVDYIFLAAIVINGFQILLNKEKVERRISLVAWIAIVALWRTF